MRIGAEVVVLSSSQQTATGPIFLEQLDCTSEDSDLLMCNSLSVPGIHSCTHSQDAGVRCKGMYTFCCAHTFSYSNWG